MPVIVVTSFLMMIIIPIILVLLIVIIILVKRVLISAPCLPDIVIIRMHIDRAARALPIRIHHLSIMTGSTDLPLMHFAINVFIV